MVRLFIPSVLFFYFSTALALFKNSSLYSAASFPVVIFCPGEREKNEWAKRSEKKKMRNGMRHSRGFIIEFVRYKEHDIKLSFVRLKFWIIAQNWKKTWFLYVLLKDRLYHKNYSILYSNNYVYNVHLIMFHNYSMYLSQIFLNFFTFQNTIQYCCEDYNSTTFS